jgi:hypothetical protein
MHKNKILERHVNPFKRDALSDRGRSVRLRLGFAARQ